MNISLRFRQNGPTKIGEDFYSYFSHPFLNKNGVRNVYKMKLIAHWRT